MPLLEIKPSSPQKWINTPLFIRASADELVDKPLNHVFVDGPRLSGFLKIPQAKQFASTLRVRKGASNGTPGQHGKRVAAGVESTSSVRVVKA